MDEPRKLSPSHLHKSMPLVFAVQAIAAISFSIILWPVASHKILAVWLSLVVALPGANILAVIYLKNKNLLSKRNYIALLYVGLYANGLLWGSTALITSPDSIEYFLLNCLFISGLSVTVLTILSSESLAGTGFLAFALVPYAVRNMIVPDSFNVMVGMTILLFTVSSVIIARIYSQSSFGQSGIKDPGFRQELPELDRLDKGNQISPEFLLHMSHEFRTPISAILGFCQLLKYEYEGLDASHRENIDEIYSAGKHLLELIDQVSDLTKVETEDIGLELEYFDLRRLLEECIQITRPIASESKNTVSTDFIQNNQMIVYADKMRLRQVFLNLLSNAFKYSDQNTVVAITCKTTPAGRIRVSIGNQGPGIDAARQQDLFVPFKRLGAEAGPIQGTGIGLVITKKLIDLMKGEIGFSSKAGEGAEFWVEIPTSAKPMGIARSADWNMADRTGKYSDK